MDVLVICIGNKARGDDGVARRVAELLEPALPATVSLHSVPQLDIVLAEEISSASLVIFVDAERRDSPAVRTDTVEPSVLGSNAHAVDPAGLLALARTLYGAQPRSALVSIAAPEMGHAEGLSETARAASEEAARVVVELLGG